jgi:Xaa-Pro aminopeptidase
MTDRIERLRGSLEDPLLVTTPVNIRYLSGFVSSNAALLVEPDRVRLFTDFRYAEAARAVEGVEFVETRRAVAGHLAELLSGRIGFEAAHLAYAEYETLSAGGIELVPTHGIVERLRVVKDEREQAAIRRSATILTRAYERLAEERFVGRTERDLAWQMAEFMHEDGAEEIAFATTVAAGANGATPHADTGDRRIEARQTVVVDAGCVVDGYCSDCTRTFATGRLSDELARAYRVCLEAQQAAVASVRAGMTGREADAVARERIDGDGFGEAFGHGLGHGVGLLVHEAPALRPESEDELASGNVVTIEPGIYLRGVGGIRIEDLVIVQDDGVEVLTGFTKDLVTVN